MRSKNGNTSVEYVTRRVRLNRPFDKAFKNMGLGKRDRKLNNVTITKFNMQFIPGNLCSMNGPPYVEILFSQSLLSQAERFSDVIFDMQKKNLNQIKREMQVCREPCLTIGCVSKTCLQRWLFERSNTTTHRIF